MGRDEYRRRKLTMTLMRSLSHRSFALLWGGQTISRLGDQLYLIALAWWVLQQTGSAAAMGAVLICAEVPLIIFLLVGGVVVDRLPRLAVMLVSDVARAIIVGVVAVLAARHHLALWHLYVLSALFGLADAFFTPAYTAVIPDLLPAEALPSANALQSISVEAAGIAGPALGGAIIATGGTALGFALDALSFGLSSLCLLALARVPGARRPMEREASALEDLGVGIRTVLGSPWLWITIAIAGVSNLTLFGPLAAALPLLVRQGLHGGVQVYALLTALQAVGALVAAVVLGRAARLRRRGLLVYGAWIVAALMLLALGLPLPVAAAGVALTIYGAGVSTLGLAWMSTLQDQVPPERLGRVASIDVLGSSALLPLGYGLAGVAADRVGAPVVFLLGGAAGALIIALGLLHPAVRHLD